MSNWQTKKLGEICKTSSGGTPSRKNKSFYDGDIPWVKSGELNFNTIRDTEEKISDKAVKESSAKVFPDGTLLIALYGATVGKLAFLGIDAATNQAVCAIMPENGLENKYLYWYLFSKRKDLVGKSIGGAQPNISQTILKDVDVPVPPLTTQHRIVEKIEELFSELDNGVENLKKAQQQLKTYRQAVLKDAFEGKLTKEWREQQDDLPTPEELLQQIKAERKAHRQREIAEWEMEVEQWEKDGKPGRKPRKPRKKSSQPPLNDEKLYGFVSLPEGWKWVQFDNVCEVKTNLVDPVDYKSYPHIAPNYIRKFTGQLLEYNSIEKDGVTSPKHLFYSGQIVYSKIRPYLSKLILAPFDGLCSADMYPIESNLNIKYLYYLMLSDVFLNQASTAGSRSVLPKINQKELGIIKLPICSMIEQEEIVNQIESSISVIDQLEQTIQENLQKAEALRQSILKKAFGGELVKEEPAKILEFQKSPQRYYKNKPTDLHAGLICKIIDAHYKNEKHLQKLNHVKCEKIIHMLESHEGIELERKPVKDAAGPDDFPKLKKIEHRANAKNWFQIDKSLGGKYGYGYKPKKSLEYAISDLEKIKGLPLKAIDKMIRIFLKMDKERAEIVATLYAAWNNFLIDGYQPSDEEIVRAAREDWSKQKLNIKRERFFKALPWMRKNGLVPSGKGKKVSDKHT